ncbi:MAG: hypothetical protein E7069_02965 [Bacteroidales bacterium]|jgi:hypothetical protein|nr:hypothetical protein [Bacteroidales bacterium]
MEQYLRVAGLNFAISTDANLAIGEWAHTFHGFAVKQPLDDAYRIHFEDAPNLKLLFEEDEQKLNLTTKTDDSIRIRYKIGLDTVVDALFYKNATYTKVRMTLCANGDARMEVCRRNACDANIDTYIHPLFNTALSHYLLRHHGSLVHSSVVNDGLNGILFTAVSGTGKSTMARLWRENGAHIINDDMNALCVDNERVVAHNIPMQLYNQAPRSTPLDAICLISQSKENYIRRCSGAVAVARFMTNTLCHINDKEASGMHTQNVDDICKRVKIFEVGFKPDADIVMMIKDTLSRLL